MSLFAKLKDTKLKSLKFGEKGTKGDSTKPYIVTDINTVDRTFNRLRLSKFDDGFVRGGIIGSTNAGITDTIRIGKFLTDLPVGPLFLTKQVALQLSNPRLEIRQGLGNTIVSPPGLLGKISNFVQNIGTRINNATGGPTRTYNLGINTLAQIPVNALGQHIVRHGFSPSMSDEQKYESIVTANNSEKDNRLTTLYKKFQLGRLGSNQTKKTELQDRVGNTLSRVSSFLGTASSIASFFGGSQLLNQISNTVNKISNVSSPPANMIIDQYSGGPNSRFGIGSTTIRRSSVTSDNDRLKKLTDLAFSKIYPTEVRDLIKADTGVSSMYRSAVKASSTNKKDTDIPFTGFAPVKEIKNSVYNIAINNKGVKQLEDIINYNEKQTKKGFQYYNGADTKGDGNYSYRTVFYNKFKKSEESGLVRNSTNFKYIPNNFGKLTSYDRVDGDQMSVVFQLLDPFDATNMHRIIFPAYINGFKVSSDATWGDVNYVGRSESFYVFNKFKRSVSFGLQIPCFNIIELREKHRALGALESSLAGLYGPTTKNTVTNRIEAYGNRLGGVLTKLYLGNYLRGEIGIINNLSYDVPNESSWDIDEQLAHNINVSVSFTVIHNALPTYKSEGGFFNPGKNEFIKNGASSFISSETALTRTGAADGIKNYYTTVTRQPNNQLRDTAIVNNIQNQILNRTGNDILNQVLSEQGAPPEDTILGLKKFFGK
jgi:hypothetical protein